MEANRCIILLRVLTVSTAQQYHHSNVNKNHSNNKMTTLLNTLHVIYHTTLLVLLTSIHTHVNAGDRRTQTHSIALQASGEGHIFI